MQDEFCLKFVSSLSKEYSLYQDQNLNNYLMLNFENIKEHFPLKKIDEAKAVYLNLYGIGYSGIIEVFCGFDSHGGAGVNWFHHTNGLSIISEKSMPSIVSDYGKLIWHGLDKSLYTEIWFTFEKYNKHKETFISLGEIEKNKLKFEKFLTDKGIAEIILPPKIFYDYFEVISFDKIKPRFQIKDRKF